MKLAFYNIFGELKNAEQETLMRLEHVLAQQGHELLVVNRDGYVTNECTDKGSFIEGVNADFIFTYNALEFALIPIPNLFSIFFHWVPIGFLPNFQALLMMKTHNIYDSFACFYEQDVFQRIAQIPAQNISFMGSSVPKDYSVAPQFRKDRKLFYVGVNMERALYSMRYGELLSELDKTGLLEIYGPKEAYGKANLWAGFDSYKGEIPFDGYSIIKKINRAGVCLAINSPMHNDVSGVSNRTFEAAAAGAVIISDDNEFVHKFFGDSVFYIDKNLSEKEASKRIQEILEWVNAHPEDAYDMACRSQNAFLENLTLDKMVSNFVESTKLSIARVHDRSLQLDVIDVVCFVDEVEDYPGILLQLERQYYQNLHLILVTDKMVYEKLESPYPNDFVQADQDFKGRAFIRVKKCLRGQYFMFIDKYSVLHDRHIYKNHEILSGRSELFSYSGCYLRRPSNNGKKYVVLNNKPILRDEFLLFSNASNENYTDWYFRDQFCFHMETIFSRSAPLFKREILTITNDDELGFISEAIHFYLACCSLIKANRLGRFTYALTTGYIGETTEEINQKVFGYSRRHWYSNTRSAKTYIKEMNEVFFKYTFESNPNNVFPRNFAGEITWYNEIPAPLTPPPDVPISKKRRFVRWLKKFVPKPIKEFIKKIIFA